MSEELEMVKAYIRTNAKSAKEGYSLHREFWASYKKYRRLNNKTVESSLAGKMYDAAFWALYDWDL